MKKCDLKASYASKKAAQAATTVARHQHGSNLKPYKCKDCGLWHLATDYRNL